MKKHYVILSAALLISSPAFAEGGDSSNRQEASDKTSSISQEKDRRDANGRVAIDGWRSDNHPDRKSVLKDIKRDRKEFKYSAHEKMVKLKDRRSYALERNRDMANSFTSRIHDNDEMSREEKKKAMLHAAQKYQKNKKRINSAAKSKAHDIRQNTRRNLRNHTKQEHPKVYQQLKRVHQKRTSQNYAANNPRMNNPARRFGGGGTSAGLGNRPNSPTGFGHPNNPAQKFGRIGTWGRRVPAPSGFNQPMNAGPAKSAGRTALAHPQATQGVARAAASHPQAARRAVDGVRR